MTLVNLVTGLPAVADCVPLRPPGGALAGMTTLQLQAALINAQAAYAQLMAGGKVVSASYSQGDGSKSVSYTAADSGLLMGFILQIQQALGMIRHARRPLRPFF